MPSLKHYKHEFRILYRCKGKQRKRLIQKALGGVIRTIAQVVKNTINGNIPLSLHQKVRFCRHKNMLRALFLAKSNIKRRLLLRKCGTLLPLLLTLILNAVAGSLSIGNMTTW